MQVTKGAWYTLFAHTPSLGSTHESLGTRLDFSYKLQQLAVLEILLLGQEPSPWNLNVLLVNDTESVLPKGAPIQQQNRFFAYKPAHQILREVVSMVSVL